MSFEHKPGSGSLFRNDKKGNDRAPDYRGVANIDGELFELAGWIKECSKGKFLSLSLKPKEERQQQAKPPQAGDPFGDMESDSPF